MVQLPQCLPVGRRPRDREGQGGREGGGAGAGHSGPTHSAPPLERAAVPEPLPQAPQPGPVPAAALPTVLSLATSS